MTSKERIQAVLKGKRTDHIPLCFNGICHCNNVFLSKKHHGDRQKMATELIELGVDTAIRLYTPTGFTRDVTVREWRENAKDENALLLHKEYMTSKGPLTQVVRKTEDYPDHIELFADHNIPPTRSKRYLVEGEADLEKLECLLKTPGRDELRAFFDDAKAAKAFCDQKGIMLTGYLLGIGDPLAWFSGHHNAILFAVDQPDFLKRYIEILAKWNAERKIHSRAQRRHRRQRVDIRFRENRQGNRVDRIAQFPQDD